MMTQEHLNSLIQKLSDNTIKDHEYEELMDFINNPSLSSDSRLNAAMSQADISSAKLVQEDQQQEEKIYSHIIADPRFTKHKRILPYWLKIAAMWICILSVASLAYYIKVFSPRNVHEDELTYKTITASNGDRKKITFKDGTIVWLNSGSRLSYSNAYQFRDREVKLSGEGYFEVAKMKDKPFIVRSADLSVTVLGTGFNINTFQPQKLAVTVAHGRVKVQDQQQELSILTQNQQLIYNASTQQAHTLSTDASAVKSWSQNVLQFDDISMSEAAEVMSRWYDVSFVFDDEKSKNCRFSVALHSGENLQKALQVIAALEGFAYSIKGKTVHIKGGGC